MAFSSSASAFDLIGRVMAVMVIDVVFLTTSTHKIEGKEKTSIHERLMLCLRPIQGLELLFLIIINH